MRGDDGPDILNPNPWYPSVSHRGTVGLVDMPTARFLPDGHLALAGSGKQPDQKAAFLFQAAPWLEAGFRYAYINGFFETQPDYYDRSVTLKLRLVREGRRTPAIALGFDDLLGTGVYGGEYLVASKRFGDFDASFGVGWGRLGSSGLFNNPVTAVSDRASERANETGQFDLEYFQGDDIGLFGGVEYTPPIKRLDGLKLQLEYSSDRYVRERDAPLIGFDVRSPINLGASYQVADWLEVGGHYLYGTTFGMRFALRTNPTKRLAVQTIGEQAPNFRVRPVEERTPNPQGEEDIDQTGDEPLPDAAFDPVLRMPRVLARRAVGDTSGIASTTLPPRDERIVETRLVAHGRRIDVGPRASDGLDEESLFDAISREAKKLYITVLGLSVEGPVLTVAVRNHRYDRSAQALGRTARFLSRHAPDDVETFDIILVNGDFPISRARIARSALERVLLAGGGPDEIRAATEFSAAPPNLADLGLDQGRKFPSFNVGLRPGFRQSLFDPDDPVRYQLLMRLGLSVGLAPGLSARAGIGINIFNNFDEITRESDSELPRVRSDFPRFLQEGETGIDRLTVDYRFKPASNLYGRLSAGYLEEMFAGVGGEILYQPQDKSWAIGGNLFAVQQREFDKLFGLQDLDAITGHASFYWDMPFYDWRLALHAGRYLAGDYGGTIQLTRRFLTGVEIGAFATFTDVPFDEFGEGSFDKGLLIRLPFGWLSPYPTREGYTVELRPLTRDGGQRLVGSSVLFDEIRNETIGDLERNFDAFTD